MAIGCNAIVGWGDFTKASPDGNGVSTGTSSSGTDGTSGGTSGQVGSGVVDAGRLCTPTNPFGAPAPVAGKVNSSAHETAPSLTADELTMFFQRTVGIDGGVILVAKRATVNDPWPEPEELPELAQNGADYAPTISGDGLTLIWSELIDHKDQKLKIAQRNTTTSTFAGVRVLTEVSNGSGVDDSAPSLSSDGQELFFTSTRGGGVRHLFHSTIGAEHIFTAPSPLSELDADSSDDAQLAVSADRLTVFFASLRAGGRGNADVWTASRPAKTATFAAPTHVEDPINTASYDWPTWLSADGCRLYMSVLPVDGAGDIVVATRPL